MQDTQHNRVHEYTIFSLRVVSVSRSLHWWWYRVYMFHNYHNSSSVFSLFAALKCYTFFLLPPANTGRFHLTMCLSFSSAAATAAPAVARGRVYSFVFATNTFQRHLLASLKWGNSTRSLSQKLYGTSKYSSPLCTGAPYFVRLSVQCSNYWEHTLLNAVGFTPQSTQKSFTSLFSVDVVVVVVSLDTHTRARTLTTCASPRDSEGGVCVFCVCVCVCVWSRQHSLRRLQLLASLRRLVPHCFHSTNLRDAKSVGNTFETRSECASMCIGEGGPLSRSLEKLRTKNHIHSHTVSTRPDQCLPTFFFLIHLGHSHSLWAVWFANLPQFEHQIT